MIKSELIEILSIKNGLGYINTERIINSFIKLVYEELAAGRTVNISGFGKFSVSHRLSRIGVNPRNHKQKITIPELNTPKFVAGEAFKSAIKLRK